MIAGKSVAMKFHQPQVVAVRLPELRLPAPRPNRLLGHDTARPAAAGLVPARPAPVRPVPAEPSPASTPGVTAVPSRAPVPTAYAGPAPRTAPTLVRSLVFALKLVASALAGAAITMLLWNDNPKRAVIDALLIDGAAKRQESAIDRVAPRGEEVQRPDRLVRSWDAESTWSDRPVPKNFPREVKTVKFIAPVQQNIVTASIGPVPGNARSNVAVPMGKPSEVKSWRYQLQGINPYVVASSSADLMVIDHAGGDGPFTKDQVEQMKRKPDGSRRIVLSYMSIGEAESYRWYWPQRSSAWLGPENPKWRGNYGVRFWHADWQQIIFEYTDKIVAAGFDGVYLDKVDEFEAMGHKDDMVEFVARISARAKSQQPDFMVVSQNGDALIPNQKFRKAIDAFAREDLFYGESSDGVRNSASSIRESVKRLKMLAAEGKPVFVVEYPRNDAQAQTARREISENNFIGLMARRALDQL